MKSILRMTVAVMLLTEASTHKLSQRHRMQNRVHSNQQGIFDKMIELATADDKVSADKHEASVRKEKQLAAAEKEHDQLVKEEEQEEEKEQQEIEDQKQQAQEKQRELKQAEEHEQLLKQLAESTDAQLANSVDLVGLQDYTQQQLIEQDKMYNSKKEGGLFKNMEEKLQIHENMQQTT